MMKNVLCCLCIPLLATLPLFAQSDAEGGRDRGAGRSAWFACTSIPDDLENPVKVLAGEKITELELPEYMASDPVTIPEDGIIRIVRGVPDPEDPAKTKYLVLAEARIPEGVREALIILMPLAQPKGDLIFHSTVQNLADFKGGDRLYINLSNTNIGVEIGDKKVAVPARRSGMYQAGNLAKPTNQPIIYRFFHPERKEWKLLSASTVVLRPTRREINVFNDGSRIGKIEKHKILFPIESPEP